MWWPSGFDGPTRGEKCLSCYLPAEQSRRPTTFDGTAEDIATEGVNTHQPVDCAPHLAITVRTSPITGADQTKTIARKQSTVTEQRPAPLSLNYPWLEIATA